jgi:O-antigen/teichoic acid export membrane protein
LKKKFITNLILLITLNLLVKPFWIFGIDMEVQNQVGAENYGFYLSLFNFSLILNVLLDLGITNYNNRKISRYQQLLPKFLSNIVAIKFLLAIFYAIIALVIAVFIGYDFRQFHILAFLILNQFLTSFTLYLRSNLSAMQYFRLDSLLSVLDKSLMILLTAILLYGNVFDEPFRIEWFVYTQTIAYLITSLAVLTIVFRKAGCQRIRFNSSYLRLILKDSWPYALLVLQMGTYSWGGVVLLERLLPEGQEQAGIYAQGNRILDAVSQFGYLFAGLLLPMFSRMIKKNEAVTQLLKLSAVLLLVPAIILMSLSWFYNHEIIGFLYDEKHAESPLIFSLLLSSFIGIGIVYIFGSLLTANGSVHLLNKIAFLGVVVNISLNLLLIPAYQAVGTAIAAVSTHFIVAAAHLLAARKVFSLTSSGNNTLRILLYTGMVVGMGFAINNLEINWFLSMLMFIVISLLIAFLIRLISLKSIYQIIRYNE